MVRRRNGFVNYGGFRVCAFDATDVGTFNLLHALWFGDERNTRPDLRYYYGVLRGLLACASARCEYGRLTDNVAKTPAMHAYSPQ